VSSPSMLSFCFALLCLMIQVTSNPSTSPFLLWSNTGLLSRVNNQIIEITDVSDIPKSFENGQETKGNIADTIPELLIVFVEPQLTTEQLSLLTHSHLPQTNGGSFSNLKRLVEDSKSSTVYPYVTTSDFNTVGTSLITSLMRNLGEAASIVLVGDSASSPGIFRGKSVTTISFEQLQEKLALGKAWNLLGNGVTDLLIVKFGSPSFNLADEVKIEKRYTVDDQLFSTVDAALAQTSYIAMFTSDSPIIHASVETSFPQSHPSLTRFERRFQQTTDQGNWPDSVVQALLVSVPLLIILFIGITCTFNVQSDLKFDAERAIKHKQ